MRSLSSVASILVFWAAVAHAQTSAPASLVDAVQVVTYVDLSPERAESASSLLIKQVQQERRSSGCTTVVLLEENGRHNHLVLIERWRSARDLDIMRNSDSYKRFRSELQPSLASPLDERMGHQIAP